MKQHLIRNILKDDKSAAQITHEQNESDRVQEERNSVISCSEVSVQRLMMMNARQEMERRQKRKRAFTQQHTSSNDGNKAQNLDKVLTKQSAFAGLKLSDMNKQVSSLEARLRQPSSSSTELFGFLKSSDIENNNSLADNAVDSRTHISKIDIARDAKSSSIHEIAFEELSETSRQVAIEQLNFLWSNATRRLRDYLTTCQHGHDASFASNQSICEEKTRPLTVPSSHVQRLNFIKPNHPFHANLSSNSPTFAANLFGPAPPIPKQPLTQNSTVFCGAFFNDTCSRPFPTHDRDTLLLYHYASNVKPSNTVDDVVEIQADEIARIGYSPKKRRVKVTDSHLSARRIERSVMTKEFVSSTAETGNASLESYSSVLNAMHDFNSYEIHASTHQQKSTSSIESAIELCSEEKSSRAFSNMFGASLNQPFTPKYSLDHGRITSNINSFLNNPKTRDISVKSASLSSRFLESMNGGYVCNDGFQQTATLTPLHLRKAKLMFFYTRYPSSSILKIYFPDVRFNKNNTAQLVKWFSNFREFYYIQIEKYARQTLLQGLKSEDDICVSQESELCRLLNLHYNRNNQIAVPYHFHLVVECTLKEFIKSISLKKDLESSWKKTIYKVIARLDQPVPEFFKSLDWMEQFGE